MAVHGGAAGRSGAGQDGMPTGRFVQEKAVPLAIQLAKACKASKTTFLDVSSEARTNEFLCKPMGEQSVRLTSGSRPVYPQDHGRSSFLAADQWTVAH